jgi:hypothetical protein
MTPEARKCFVNSICYIKQFEGQKPLVRRNTGARQWALVYAGYLKTIKDEKFLEQLFPEELRKRFGSDAEKYVRYYQENLEYLHPSPSDGKWVVDDDVKDLELSNRQVELLDRCVSMLEKGEKSEVALRILKRYTNERFTEGCDWKAWLEKNRSRLFFSDVGGFKFFIAPQGKQAAASR